MTKAKTVKKPTAKASVAKKLAPPAKKPAPRQEPKKVASLNEKPSAKYIEKKPGKTYQHLMGFKDYLGKDFLTWDLATAKAWELARSYGFMPIKTPILEELGMYKKTTRLGLDKEFFTVDLEHGEKAVLRPELTQGMFRAYLENKTEDSSLPARLFSIGSVFRQDKIGGGRYREFTHLDLEIIGEAKPVSEALIINTAYRYLKELGLNFQLQINSLGDQDARRDYSSKLNAFFKERGRRTKLCNNCKKALLKSPLALLDCREEDCTEAREGGPQIADFLSVESREHFSKVLEYLDDLNIPYNFNSYLVRGLNYYSETVFEFWPLGSDGTANSRQALGAGGRCDSLLTSLGGKESACGVAIGLERVTARLKEQNAVYRYPDEQELVYVAQLSETARARALLLFEELRLAGFNVRQSFSVDGLKAQIEEANNLQAKVTLILGKKEIMDETILLRDMESGVQETVALKKIKDRLDKKINRKVGVIYG